jgi:hypothetical protein
MCPIPVNTLATVAGMLARRTQICLQANGGHFAAIVPFFMYQMAAPLVGFVVDKVALGRVLSEYFGFPCQILHHHNHPGQATIGQTVAAVPSGPRWTPPSTKRIKKIQ